MPIGGLVHTGVTATLATPAAARRRSRRSNPFRLSYRFGFSLNWPALAFVVLLVSTALAVDHSGSGLPLLWVCLGLAALASTGLAILREWASQTGPALERALHDGLGSGWNDRVGAQLAGRLRRRPSLPRLLFAPITVRRPGVERIANIRYGPERRGKLLDLYRDRSGRPDRPALVYLHAGHGFGSKGFRARRLLSRLASDGWVCVSANYGLLPAEFPDPLIDAKKVIAWVREHGHEYGASPTAVFLAGSSAGGHLASLAALTPNDPLFQPGFEGADTSVAGAISLFGYYGSVAWGDPPSSPLAYVTRHAPPFFIVHGEQDTAVIVDDARDFAEQLRGASSNPVVYAELRGAQRAFDFFRSRRFETFVDAIEAFAASVRPLREGTSLQTGVFDHAALGR